MAEHEGRDDSISLTRLFSLSNSRDSLWRSKTWLVYFEEDDDLGVSGNDFGPGTSLLYELLGRVFLLDLLILGGVEEEVICGPL